MKQKKTTLDLVIKAARKLHSENGEWRNVLTFILSCYCGRVGTYDLDGVLDAFARLSDEEEHALISWVIQQDEIARGK